MSVIEIIRKLREDNIELSVDNGKLRLRGNKIALGDSDLLELVRKNKQEIIAKLSSGEYLSSTNGLLQVPPNLIPADCAFITPELLSLVNLKQVDIDRIVATVPGGAGNVQDIYALAPLQEGMLFHHVLEKEGDVYLVPSLVSISSIERLNRYIAALQAVINRHDILRTSVVWEGLPEPVQVVWRRAPLVMEQLTLDPAIGEIADQLLARFDPRHYRLDLRQAPLWRLFVAEDVPNHRWLLLQLTHHLIGDLTSGEVLHREMEACLSGRADQLPATAPFRNLVVQARSGISREEHESFFTRMLGDVDEPTAPFGLTDVQRDGSRTAEAHRQVESILCQRLRVLTRALGVSAASVCHVAWAMVLARLSGRDDVVFGTMMVGRMQGGAGADHAVGLFINALPLRIKTGDEGAEASVRKTHELLIQLLRHEHASLALAQRCSAVRAPAPLFTAMMNYRFENGGNQDAKALAASSETWAGIEHLSRQERINYPLGLAINDLGEKLSVDVQADDSIDPELVCALTITALESLITALEQAPTTPIRKLEILPLSERNRLLRSGNGGPPVESIPGLLNGGLYDLVTAQAERNPDSIAIVEPGREITYRQLVERADGVGRQLKKLGAGPETRVALLADRSAESLVGMLGILAAGAAYVPLDPLTPTERWAFVLDNASVLALLTPTAFRERASRIAAQCPELESRILGISEAPASDVPLIRNVSGDSAAYVIYTSGTTGTPNGVVVNHRSAVNLVHAFLARHNFVDQRLLMIPPLIFDASVGDVFPILAVGATLVLHPSPTELGSPELQEFCEQYRVTAIDSPAGLWRRWAEGLAGSLAPGRVLPGVRLMMFGGESVPLDQVRRFARLTENRIALCNHYGPTEATVCATMLTTRDGAGLDAADLPIGKPLPGVRVYVLDGDLQLAPRGVEGELYIGGVGVAREYLGDSELTAKRFLHDPFSGGADARMYRTGDFVRWNSDDTLQFFGRRDDQVKIRGFRIELGEIEAKLTRHARVREAVVLARQDGEGDKRLVAYVTSDAAESLDMEELRTHVAAVLPEYMAPAAYVLLPAFPLTSNGKLDRKALPAPDFDDYVTRKYEAPVGEVENTLARIWADVLKLERVGRRDNFFELGGHSLLAVTLIERMRRADLQVDVRALFATPTMMGLAAMVGGASRAATAPPNLIPPDCDAITPAMLPLLNFSQADIDKVVDSVPGGAGNVQDIYPLAPLQEGFLFHHLLESEGDVYLSPTLVGFDTRERLDRYTAALQAVIERHDILRTSVFWEDLPEPVQAVWRYAPLVVEEISFDPADGDVAGQLCARFDPRHHRLDVRQAPMWRLFIAEDHAKHRWLALDLMHHLMGDHMTLQVLYQEIQAVLLGHLDELPTPVPFRNLIAQARLGVSHKEHQAFFSRMLGDVDVPTAPFGLTDVRGNGRNVVKAHRDVSPELCRRLHTRTRALGVSAASVYHLAWAMVLAQVCRRDDVTFGTMMSGRMHGGEGMNRVMGVFINTLPVRIRVGDESVQAAVRKTHELLIQLMRHEHAPLASALRCSGVRAPTPLFTSVLNYRHQIAEAVKSSNENSESSLAWAGMEFLGQEELSNYPFYLLINDLGERLYFDLQADGSIDPEGVCDLLYAALNALIEGLELAPASPVRRHVLSPAQRHEISSGWDDAPAEATSQVYVHPPYEPPQGEIETSLAELWRGLLNVDPIGRHDSFFELGGHSLTAVRLVAAMRQTFNMEVPLSDIFAHPMLNDLAGIVPLVCSTS